MERIELEFKYRPDNYTIYLKDRNAWIKFLADEKNRNEIYLDLKG